MSNLNQLVDKKSNVVIKKKKYYFLGAIFSVVYIIFFNLLPIENYEYDLVSLFYEDPYQWSMFDNFQSIMLVFFYLVILCIFFVKSRNNIKYKFILKGSILFSLIAAILVFLYMIFVILPSFPFKST